MTTRWEIEQYDRVCARQENGIFHRMKQWISQWIKRARPEGEPS